MCYDRQDLLASRVSVAPVSMEYCRHIADHLVMSYQQRLCSMNLAGDVDYHKDYLMLRRCVASGCEMFERVDNLCTRMAVVSMKRVEAVVDMGCSLSSQRYWS